MQIKKSISFTLEKLQHQSQNKHSNCQCPLRDVLFPILTCLEPRKIEMEDIVKYIKKRLYCQAFLNGTI